MPDNFVERMEQLPSLGQTRLDPADINVVDPIVYPTASQARAISLNRQASDQDEFRTDGYLTDLEMGVIQDRSIWDRMLWEFSNENTIWAPITNTFLSYEWSGIFSETDLNKRGGITEFLSAGNNRTYIETMSGMSPDVLVEELPESATPMDLLKRANARRTIRQREADRENVPEGFKTLADFLTIGPAAVIDPVNLIPVSWVGRTLGIRKHYYLARAASSKNYHRFGTPLYASVDWFAGSAVGAGLAEVVLAETAGDAPYRDPVTNTIFGATLGAGIGFGVGSTMGAMRPRPIPQSYLETAQVRQQRLSEARRLRRDQRRIQRGEGPLVMAERAIDEATAAVRYPDHIEPGTPPSEPTKSGTDAGVTQLTIAGKSLAEARKADELRIPPPTEAAVKLAEDLGYDISTIEGSGRGGRITQADVRRASKGSQEAPLVPRKVDDTGQPLETGSRVFVVDEAGQSRITEINDDVGIATTPETTVIKIDYDSPVGPEPKPLMERAKDSIDIAITRVESRIQEIESRLQLLSESDEFSTGITKKSQDKIDREMKLLEDTYNSNLALVQKVQAENKGKGRGAGRQWTPEEKAAKESLPKLKAALKNLSEDSKQRFLKPEFVREAEELDDEWDRLFQIKNAVDEAEDPELLVKLINDFEQEHMRGASGEFGYLNFQIRTDKEYAKAVLEVLKDMKDATTAKKAELAAKVSRVEKIIEDLETKELSGTPEYKEAVREFHSYVDNPLFDARSMSETAKRFQQAEELKRQQTAIDKFLEGSESKTAADSALVESQESLSRFQEKMSDQNYEFSTKDYRLWKTLKREIGRLVSDRATKAQQAFDDVFGDIPGFTELKGNMNAQIAFHSELRLLSKDLNHRALTTKQTVERLQKELKSLEDKTDALEKVKTEEDASDINLEIAVLDRRISGISDELVKQQDELQRIHAAQKTSDENIARADAAKAALVEKDAKIPNTKILVEYQKLYSDMLEWEDQLAAMWSPKNPKSNFMDKVIEDEIGLLDRKTELAEKRLVKLTGDDPEIARDAPPVREDAMDDRMEMMLDAMYRAKGEGKVELLDQMRSGMDDYFDTRGLTFRDVMEAAVKKEHQEVLTWLYADKVGKAMVDRVMDTNNGKQLSLIEIREKWGEEIDDDGWWDLMYQSNHYSDTEVNLLKAVGDTAVRAHLMRFFDVVHPDYRQLLSGKVQALVVDDLHYIRMAEQHAAEYTKGSAYGMTDLDGELRPVLSKREEGLLFNMASTIRESQGRTFDQTGAEEGAFLLVKRGVVGNTQRELEMVSTLIHEMNHFLYTWSMSPRAKARGIAILQQEWSKLAATAANPNTPPDFYDALFESIDNPKLALFGDGQSKKAWIPFFFTKMSSYADRAAPVKFSAIMSEMPDPSQMVKYMDRFIKSLDANEARAFWNVILEETIVDGSALAFTQPRFDMRGLNSIHNRMVDDMASAMAWFGGRHQASELGRLTRQFMYRLHRGKTKFDALGKRDGMEVARVEQAARNTNRRLARKVFEDELNSLQKGTDKVLLFQRILHMYTDPKEIIPNIRPLMAMINDTRLLPANRVDLIARRLSDWANNRVDYSVERFGQELDREVMEGIKVQSQILQMTPKNHIALVSGQYAGIRNNIEYMNEASISDIYLDDPQSAIELFKWTTRQAVNAGPDFTLSGYKYLKTHGSMEALIQERLLNKKAIDDIVQVFEEHEAKLHSKSHDKFRPIATVADFIRLKAIADREISGSIIDNAPDDFAAEIGNALFDDTAVVFGDAEVRGGVRAEHIRMSFIAMGLETSGKVNQAWIRYRLGAGLEPSKGGLLLEKATGTIRVHDKAYRDWFNTILQHLEKGTNATDDATQSAVEAMRSMYDRAYAQFDLSGVVPTKTRVRNETTGKVMYAPHLWNAEVVRARKGEFTQMVVDMVRRKAGDDFDMDEALTASDDIYRSITENGIVVNSKAMAGLHINIGKRTGNRTIRIDEPWKFREAGFFEAEPQKYIHRFAATWGGKHATNSALAKRFGVDLDEGLTRLMDDRDDVVFTIEAGYELKRLVKNARKKKAENRSDIETFMVESLKADSGDNAFKSVWHRVRGNRDLRSELLYHLDQNFQKNRGLVKDEKAQVSLSIKQRKFFQQINRMMNHLEGAMVDEAGDPVVGAVGETLNNMMIATRLGKLPFAMLQEMASHAFHKLIPGDSLSRHLSEMLVWWRSMSPSQQKVMQQIITRIDPWRLRGVGEEIGEVGDRAMDGLDPNNPRQQIMGGIQRGSRDAAQSVFRLSGASKVEEFQRLLAAKIMVNEMIEILPRWRDAALRVGEGRMTKEILRDVGIQDSRAWYEYNKLGWTVEKIEALSRYRTVEPDGWVHFDIDRMRLDAHRKWLTIEGKNSAQANATRKEVDFLYEVADTYFGSVRNRVDAMVVSRNINSTPTYASNGKVFAALFTSLRGFSLNYQTKFNRVAHQRGEYQLANYFAQSMVWGLINLVAIKGINGDITDKYIQDMSNGKGSWSFLMESALRTGISAGWFGDLLTTLYYNGNADTFMTPAAVGYGQDLFNQTYKTGVGLLDFIGLVDKDETSSGYWPMDDSAAGKKNTEGFLNILPVYNLWQIDAFINNAILQPDE